MNKLLTAEFRGALGQAGLLVGLLLTAFLLGLVPDRLSAVRHGRAALAEALALEASGSVTQQDIRRLKTTLELIVERNDDLLSAAVRPSDRSPIVMAGNHKEKWHPMTGECSSDSQVCISIYQGSDKWGQLELRFASANMFAGFDFTHSQVVALMIFMAVASFVIFYLYLGKILKNLDPSRAIPARVRSVLDKMDEGLMVVDLHGNIVLANNAIASILDKDVNSLLGWKANDFAWEASSGCLLDHRNTPWTRCLTSGESERNISVHLSDTDHRRHMFLVNCSPIMTTGETHGWVLIRFDNVTQLEEKKSKLGKAKVEAEAAKQTKSKLLAKLIHQIRTPMNATLGFTGILRRGYGQDQQDRRKHLNTIHSSGTHLLELTNDILDLSKVETGQLEVERVSCAPHGIVREVLQTLAGCASEKGITLSYEADGPIPESIISDPARLGQIVTNLVDNAIKLTDAGGVKVVLRLVGDRKPQLRVDVHDNGTGMSEEQMDRIFDPFSQADSSIIRRVGGSGLGLSISLRDAEAMGGKITVQSVQGKGSVFSVFVDTGSIDGIKRVQPDKLDTYEAPATDRQVSWAFDSKRVLVIDDGTENRELVSLVLQETGAEVSSAENGKVGVEMALREEYDLILMDMQIPVMDGYAATRLLRERGLKTPIFALTAYAKQRFEKECLEVGCSGILTKPIDIDLLLETVGKVLGSKRTEGCGAFAAVADHASEQPAAAEEPPLISNLPLHIPRFATVVAKFVQRLNEQLPAMQAALETRDFKQLANLAHWLKGSGGTVGFPAFTAPATHLESSAKDQAIDQIVSTLDEIRSLVRRVQLPEQTTGSQGEGGSVAVAFGDGPAKTDSLIKKATIS